MSFIARIRSASQNLFRKTKKDEALDDEVRGYVDLLAEEKMRQGMNPEQAHRAARIESGGIEQVKENVREARAGAWLDSLLQDVRYGLRMLVKNWKLASIAAFSLAVAMTLSVAGLSIANGVLIRPPLAAEPGRLVTVYTATPSSEFDDVSYEDYKYY